MPSKDDSDALSVIIGRNPVREALAGGEVHVERVLVQRKLSGRWVDLMRRDAARRSIPVQFVPRTKLDKLAGGGTHQGIAAMLAPVGYQELEVMLHRIAANPDVVRAERPVVLMLDQIEDPRNYGAILRSAVGAGVSGVIVPDRHMAPLSAVAVKASAGAALRLPIARTGNLSNAIDQLKERGYWIAGTAGEGATSVWDMNWSLPLVIVIGSEGKGLRKVIQDKCDYVVSIPIRGPVKSLNASVAAGIVLFAAVRERGEAPNNTG